MTISIVMTEWQTLDPDDEPELHGLYFDTVAEKRLVAATEPAISFTETRHGLSIQTKSYIGRIQIGNLRLTIQPKIRMRSLLNLFCYAYQLRDLTVISSTRQAVDERTFQDLLIQEFLAETEHLIGRGLRRDYVRKREGLTSPRGKIDIQRIIHEGGIVRGELICEHYPRLLDTVHNQILLAGLNYCVHLTEDIYLRSQLRRISHILDLTVSPVQLTKSNLEAAFRQMNRLSQSYETAFVLLQLLFGGSGISISDSDSEVQIPGFLFNMNIFWEALLSRFLKENLPDYTVHDQYQMSMMSYDADFNPKNRRNPKPRPDYVITRDNRIVAILDAKYINLWEKGVDANLLYQLGMYALGHDDVHQSKILYPTVDEGARIEKIYIQEAIAKSVKGSVCLIPVNLYQIESLLFATGYAGRQARQSFAHQIALSLSEQS